VIQDPVAGTPLVIPIGRRHRDGRADRADTDNRTTTRSLTLAPITAPRIDADPAHAGPEHHLVKFHSTAVWPYIDSAEVK